MRYSNLNIYRGLGGIGSHRLFPRPLTLPHAASNHAPDQTKNPVDNIQMLKGARVEKISAEEESALKQANPSFDDLELTEELYKEMGLSEEEIREQMDLTASSTQDPEGFDLGLDGLSSLDPDVDLPLDVKMRLVDKNIYGPESLVLAGFRAEEAAIARALLDSAGGQSIKVLPCTNEMLYGSVDEAVWASESDWGSPRPQSWDQGGAAWGAQRAIMFAGLNIKAQATIIELFDSAGLDNVSACMATEEEAQRRLGDVLAEAVKEQRRPRNVSVDSEAQRKEWSEYEERMVSSTRGLQSLDQLLGNRARERLESFKMKGQGGADGGQAPEFKFKSGSGSGSGSGSDQVVDLDDLMEAITSPGVSVDLDNGKNLEQQEAAAEEPHGKAVGETEGKSRNELEKRFLNAVFMPPKKARASKESPQTISPPSPPPLPPNLSTPNLEADEPSLPDDDLTLDAEFEDMLDNILPSSSSTSSLPTKPAPPSSTPQPPPSTPQPLPPFPRKSPAPSVLSQVQEALKAGMSPDDLKKMIDQAYAMQQEQPAGNEEAGGHVGQQEEDSVMIGQKSYLNFQPSSMSSSPPSPPPPPLPSQPPTPPKAVKPQVPYGPARPPSPPPNDDPLLQLRPETRKALQGKNVKFVDLNKLPKKYKERIVGQIKSKKEQKEMEDEEMREREEEMKKMEALTSQLTPPSASSSLPLNHALNPLSAASNEDGGISFQDFIAENPDPKNNEGQEKEGGEGDGSNGKAMTAAQVFELAETAASAGLSVKRALAEAMALGVHIPLEAAAEAGVSLPSRRLVERVRVAYESPPVRRGLRGRRAAMAQVNDADEDAQEEEEEQQEEEEVVTEKAPVKNIQSLSSWSSKMRAPRPPPPSPKSPSRTPKWISQNEVKASNMTLEDLRKVAEKKGVSLELLVENARARGITFD